MGRIARVVFPGCPYHVTHRGNRREPVFFGAEDRRRYLQLLRMYAQRSGMRIWCYCLMSNHVHLIVVGDEQHSLARAIGYAHARHSSWVNKCRGWTGHLWANRFYSSPLDEDHLWAAARYAELNPVRAGLARRAEEYPWSSARAHTLGLLDSTLATIRPFPGSIENWGRWLAEGMADPRFATIRANTSTGRPSGSPEFVRLLERRLGRVLRPSRRSPKPQEQKP